MASICSVRVSSMLRHSIKRLHSSKTFTKYLLLTNIVISGAVDSLGDITEQRVVEEVQPHDWGRTSRMGLVGLMFGAPDHYWYKYLDRRYPGRCMSSISKKVALDMLIMGTVGTVAFYVGMCKLEGKSWLETRDEVNDKFLTTFLLDLIFWPPAQVINFYFIPPSMRVAYVNVLFFGWSMILSFLKHNNVHPRRLFPVSDQSHDR